VTQLRCGGIFNNHVIANIPQCVPVKEFLKSVTIWQRYRQKLGGMFFESRFKSFTGGHIGKWLPFASRAEFVMAPYLKISIRV